MSEVLLDQRDLGRGPATIITGGPEVAQNIAEAVAIPFGSLPWDRQAGSHLFEQLNDVTDRPATITEIRRVAKSFNGVVKSSVSVRWNPRARRYEARFVPRGENRAIVVPIRMP